MSLGQWKLDYSYSSKNCRTSDSSFNPPGFYSTSAAVQHNAEAEKSADQHEHLARKRAWDTAIGPIKSLPMNLFMMYMAGGGISIFPIMMVGMMLWRPFKALFSVNATFKPLESPATGNMLLNKVVFCLGNFGAIGLAVYKVHTMGLLPNTPSDWLEFIPQATRAQYSIVDDVFI